MVKVTIVDPKLMKRGKQTRAKNLPSKQVRSADGRLEKVYVIDTGDPAFRDQFKKVFQLNVTRARRAKRAVGSAVAAK